MQDVCHGGLRCRTSTVGRGTNQQAIWQTCWSDTSYYHRSRDQYAPGSQEAQQVSAAKTLRRDHQRSEDWEETECGGIFPRIGTTRRGNHQRLGFNASCPQRGREARSTSRSKFHAEDGEARKILADIMRKMLDYVHSDMSNYRVKYHRLPPSREVEAKGAEQTGSKYCTLKLLQTRGSFFA